LESYVTRTNQAIWSSFCLHKYSSVTKLSGKTDFRERHFRSPELDNAKDAREINFNAKDARDAKDIDANDFIYEKISNRRFCSIGLHPVVTAGFCSIGFYPVVTAGL